ncbi:MAG TPA: ribonuclease Y [Candidatus Bipolaricaulota bacterium]
MEYWVPLLILAVAIPLGGVGYWFGQVRLKAHLQRQQRWVDDLLAKSKEEGEQLKKAKILEAQAEIQRRWDELHSQIKQREQTLSQNESRLIQREERLDQKSEQLAKAEESLQEDIQAIKALLQEGQTLFSEERGRLEELAHLSEGEAREQLMKQVESEAQQFIAKRIRQLELKAQDEAKHKSLRIIATTLQRYAGDSVNEYGMSVVALPREEYKGRIIGKEGRNIRAFEALTGVEVLVDETPDTVALSCFHPIRREVARLSMEKLIDDGRIHPVQIKKYVEKAKEQVEDRIRELGQEAVFQLGLGGLHPELVMLVGRLHFRTSFGQNQLNHTMEVSSLAGMLASELGLDPKAAKRAGLLHDIGKAVDHQVEGSHSLISAEFARRYGEPEEICHAIAAHNEEVEPRTVLAVILQAADALSAARPGARQETYESYVQRLENLEAICKEFKGVREAFAVQAGREVRIMVQPEEVDDDMSAKMAYDIARCIEDQLSYPGEIKVHVIRSIEFTQSAK